MGKDRIDLNNLLAKYQTGIIIYLLKQYYEGSKFNLAHNQSRQKYQVEQQFYGKKSNTTSNFYQQTKNQIISSNNNYQKVYQNIIDKNVQNLSNKARHNYNQKYVGNFQMSKQECQSFLESVGNILQSQKNSYQIYPQHILIQIKRQFQRQHQQIRRQIIQTLDNAFKQNYRKIQEQLNRQNTKNPIEFKYVNQKIEQTKRQIIQFIKKLNSNDDFIYRQAISKVVLKDYTNFIENIKKQVITAKQQYKNGLGQVQPDRNRIQCLKNDLSNLFYFKKKDVKIIQKSIFSVLGGANHSNSPTKNYNVNSNTIDCGFQPIYKQASRTRKSFFNFGN